VCVCGVCVYVVCVCVWRMCVFVCSVCVVCVYFGFIFLAFKHVKFCVEAN